MGVLAETLFESLLEAAPDSMVGVDDSGVIQFVNRQTELLFGYDRDELIGQPIEILVPESFRAGHPARRNQYFTDPVTRPMGAGLNLSGQRRDGTQFPVDISLSSVRTERGLLVMAAVRDVTVQRKVQAKFESLLEAAPDAMVGVESSGKIRFVNRQTELLFGYDRDELIGQPIEVLVPEALRGGHPRRRDGYFHDPTPRPMGAGLDLKARRRDGSEFPVDISLSSIETEDGLLVTAAVRDITATRSVDQDLRRMRDLIQSTDEAVISKSIDGTVLTWNKGAERLFGYTESEMVGTQADVIIPDGHDDEIPELLRRIGSGEGAVHFETVRTRKDGTVIDVSMTVSPILDLDGRVVAASKIARDISERKRMDRALIESANTIRNLNSDLEKRVDERTAELTNALHELESFSYSVSHDLRAPLRAIDGFTRILVEDYADRLDDEGRRLLGIITSGANSMAHLIDDLLSFSRLGRQQMQSLQIDMGALAKSVVTEVLMVNGGDRKPSITVGDLPFAVGDSGMVRQVFVNLISNAVKFSSQREDAVIEVGGAGGDGEATYWVRDNGVGFDARYQDKLFQVFQRLHTSDFEGTGVGLAIVHRIVTRHGGRVWANGAVNEGATFHFTLPIREKVDA